MATFTNPLQAALEVTYLFPLSFSATVVRFRLTAGSRVLEGNAEERAEESGSFQGVKTPRFLAHLLAKERANVFSVRVGSLAPGETVEVELAYGEQLEYRAGEYAFRFPLLMDSCFHSGAPVPAPESGEQISGSPPVRTLAPGLGEQTQLSISVHAECAGLSPTHVGCSQKAVTERLPTGDFSAELAEPMELLPRDFVLSFNPWGEQKPMTWLRASGEHFLLSVLPPANPLPGGSSRDLVILLDGSDNMSGDRFDIVRRSVGHVLKSLTPDERFAVVCFNRDLAGYRQGIFCDAEEVTQGLQWLSQFEPRGRADLTILLERVLQLQPEGNRLLSVMLFTAGHVGNERELYESVKLSGSATRFFSVSVDAVQPDPFLVEVVRLTYGSSFMLTPGEDPDLMLEQLVEDTRQPMLVDFQLVDRGLGPKRESLVPDKIGHLSHNRPINLLGIRSGNGGLEIRGKTPGGQVWGEATNPVKASNPAIGVVWAQQKTAELGRELFLHTGTHSNRIRQQILALSKKYRLLTDYTAFVVTEDGEGVVQPALSPRVWEPEAPESRTDGREPGAPRAGLVAPPSAEQPAAPTNLRPGLRVKNGGAEGRPGLRPKAVHGLKSKLEPKVKMHGAKASYSDKPTLPARRPTAEPESPQPAPPPAVQATTAASESYGHFAQVKPAVVDPAPVQLEAPPVYREPAQLEAPPVYTEPVRPEPAFHPQAVTPASAEPSRRSPVQVPVQGVEPAESASEISEEEQTPPPLQRPAPEENPIEHAKQLLRSDDEMRRQLMGEMRLLHVALRNSEGGAPDPNLSSRMQSVLKLVAALAPQSSVLFQVHDVGGRYYQLFQSDPVEGLAKLQFWLQRFATLFR